MTDFLQEKLMRKWLLMMTLISTLILSGCGYNTLQSTDEQIKASWAEAKVFSTLVRKIPVSPNIKSSAVMVR